MGVQFLSAKKENTTLLESTQRRVKKNKALSNKLRIIKEFFSLIG